MIISPPPFCCCTPHTCHTLAYSAQEADTGPYKHICAQVDKVFEGMLSSRCVGTFSPRAALLRAPYFGCRVRFPDHILACCTLLSMRADAFAPCSPCAGTSATTPQQQQQAAAAAAAVSGASSSQQQPAAAAAAAKTAAAAALAPRRAATADGGFR